LKSGFLMNVKGLGIIGCAVMLWRASLRKEDPASL